MKKYIAMAGLLFLSFSCSDLLTEDPKASLTTEGFYKTASDLDLATTGLYNLIGLTFNQTAGFASTFGSDEMTSNRDGNKASWSDFDTFQATSSNNLLAFWWTNFYKTIKSCNVLLANYTEATDATETALNNAAGQAYYLRAMSYFFLTRVWGEIPLVTDASTNYTREKASVQDIYTQIISDLQQAETMLPDTWKNDSKRYQNGVNIAPTTGSAKALLANVYLTMAGWPLKQTDKYALAAAKAKEVIDNKATYGYSLVDINILWKKENNFSSETVYGIYYNTNIAEFVYPNTNMMILAYSPSDEGAWGDAYGELSFYKRFPSGARKDATYQMVYYPNNDPTKAIDYTETTYKHPYFQKYRDDDAFNPTNHVTSNWIGSHTVPVIRYAEVLLTYAEAKAMADGVDATAYDAINEVRTRAGLKNLTTGLSAEAFRDSVVVERGWEFAGCEPAARWFDLQRTETVAKANSNRDASETKLVGTPNDVTHAFYWAEIPIYDQLLDGTLVAQ
ncbi:MAG TPA: RagB/SusD family nutrient uptake outer membrane protein [Ohtaekwangia sp.]|uniref:RagB/SusD family nutrient uptake outer membrane protein n=1 Tax=Ohtaekwangia sp. TaxID=2066019 RepID=UPI002F91EB27